MYFKDMDDAIDVSERWYREECVGEGCREE